ncbi:Intradiol ring-cleavage dioxygenase [Leucosporidium creatinivorum]|uniref:Intradiol ring-cleavage dioxygenase n=1 Tax=Leucosporidium creatinivorum TaxID=106004 RepID=A0A1Y2G3H2_9BASI|nr:Intradiol ring-cleavage dioxygenase [Leucosporidium creatinivorum]
MSLSAHETDSTKKVGKAVLEAIKAGAPNIDLSLLPDLVDMSPASITENVHAINSLCPDPRQKFVFEKLVTHLHDFAREVSLTTEEWMSAIHFLTATGKICSDIRQEFILLSDIFGLSALVDSMNHPVVAPATEGTVLGPFFTEDAKELEAGQSIASEGKGEYMWCEGRILDIEGNPVANCKIETWETDDEGLYDTQYEGRTEADCRGRLTSDENGYYSYRAILPTPYPIPNDGPVGGLLKSLNRHVFRPAHLHMMFYRDGYETLITALYFKGDPYLKSDAVFGVKTSLIVDPQLITDESKSRALGFKNGPYWHLEKDYVLLTSAQAEEQKRKSLAHYYSSLQ